MGKFIRVESNGNQPPYGIGEIIQIIPRHHTRKIQIAINKYFTKPTLRCDICLDKVWLMESYDNPTKKITTCRCFKREEK